MIACLNILQQSTVSLMLQLIVVVWILFVVSSVSAVVLYWIIYWLYVPTALLTYPIHFTFPSQTITHPAAPFSPASMFRLSSATSSRRLLAKYQSYDVSVELELPESNRNYDAGMFMVNFALSTNQSGVCKLLPNVVCFERLSYTHEKHAVNYYNTENRGAVITSRPASLRYRSTIKYLIDAAMWVVPLSLGLISEHQTIHVSLLEAFYDAELLQSTQLWTAITLSEPGLEVVSAELHVRAHYEGAAYLMHDWFFITFAVSSWVTAGTIFLFLAVILYFLWDSIQIAVFGLEGSSNVGKGDSGGLLTASEDLQNTSKVDYAVSTDEKSATEFYESNVILETTTTEDRMIVGEAQSGSDEGSELSVSPGIVGEGVRQRLGKSS